MEIDAFFPQGLAEALAHIRIEVGHYLAAALDHGDFQATHMECFGHLQADIAAADNHRSLRLLLGKCLFEP